MPAATPVGKAPAAVNSFCSPATWVDGANANADTAKEYTRRPMGNPRPSKREMFEIVTGKPSAVELEFWRKYRAELIEKLIQQLRAKGLLKPSNEPPPRLTPIQQAEVWEMEKKAGPQKVHPNGHRVSCPCPECCQFRLDSWGELR